MTGPAAGHDFSFGRMAAKALGAATLVLVVATPLVWWLSSAEHELIALAVALGAIVVMIGVIALMTRRELRHVQRRIDELKARRPERT